MTQLGKASVAFTGDTKGVDAALKGVSGGLKGLGGLVAKLAPIIGLGAIGRSIVTESIASQRATGQLGAVIRSTGGAAGRSIGQLEGMATALQKTTTFGDEATKGVQGLLLTFTKIKGEMFDAATEAVLDMATAMAASSGGEPDLKSASIQVGKALNDPIRGISALMKAGVQFTNAQRRMVADMMKVGDVAGAQRVILGELETQFGGSAEAARTELGGALQYLKNQWGDLFEVSKNGSSGIINAINQIADRLPALRAFADSISLADLRLVAIAATAVMFGKIIVTLSGAVTALSVATGALHVAWMTGPLGIIAAGGLALGFSVLAGNIAAARRELKQFGAQASDTTDTNINLLRSLRPDLYAKLPAAMRGVGGGGGGGEEEDAAFRARLKGMLPEGQAPTATHVGGPGKLPERIKYPLPPGATVERATVASTIEGRTRVSWPTPQLGPWQTGAGRGSGFFGGQAAEPSKLSQVLSDVGSKMKGMAGAVGGVLSALNPFAFIMESVQRAFGDFLVSMTPIIEVLASALMPILKALFPILKLVVIAATYVGQVFFSIAGGVAKAIGWLIKAIGKAIDALPFVSGKSIIKAGEAMLDLGSGFFESVGELGKARDEIKDMEWQEATDGVNKLGEAANETAAALRNVPAGFKVNAARFRFTQTGLSTTATNTGGGVVNISNVTVRVDPSDSPERAWGRVVQGARAALARGDAVARDFLQE